MFLSAMSVLVVAQSSTEIPEGLMNNPVYIYVCVCVCVCVCVYIYIYIYIFLILFHTAVILMEYKQIYLFFPKNF